MVVNKEILEKYSACETGLKWFNENFSGDAELINVIERLEQVLDISIEAEQILHWGYRTLPTSLNERDMYREILEVDTSDLVWESRKVFDSEKVSNSKEVYHSKNIEDSTRVCYSKNVDMSLTVNKSELVFSSEDVHSSTLIGKSKFVNISEDVLASEEVVGSKHIFASKEIAYSVGLSECDNCVSCYFSSNLKNCDYCLFCDGLTDKEYYIFNKPVDEHDFFVIQAAVMKIFENEKSSLINYVENEKKFSGVTPVYVSMIYQFYLNFSEDFFNYMKTIPNYNDFIIYKITLRADLLEI